MIVRDRFWWALFAIGIVTVANGLVQLLAPDFVLRIVAFEVNAIAKHLIASLGMLVSLFGGMFLYAILDERPQYVAVLWAGIAKFGTAIAIGLGVQHTTFIAPVLALALFDLVAGIMIVGYWFRLKQHSAELQSA